MNEVEKYLASIISAIQAIREHPEAVTSIDMRILPYIQDIDENIWAIVEEVEDEDDLLGGTP